MKTTNEIYSWQVKEGACRYMAKILNFPETVDHRMDGKICRITVTSLTIHGNIKKLYHKEIGNDCLWQVHVLGIKDREFLVLQSQLVELEEVVVLDEEGRILFQD